MLSSAKRGVNSPQRPRPGPHVGHESSADEIRGLLLPADDEYIVGQRAHRRYRGREQSPAA